MGYIDNSIINKRLKIFSRILFLAYSFAYLAFYQTDLERYVHGIITGGVIPFHPYLLALIFSVVLVVIEIPFSYILKFKGAWEPCNYVPSVFLLCLSSSYTEERFLGHSWQIWVAISVAFVILILLLKLFSELNWTNKLQAAHALRTNLVISVILFLLPPLLGNSDERYHRELRAEYLMGQGKYDKVLSVGRNAEETTSRLEYLRAEALARVRMDNNVEGSALGARLFDYPQHYAVSTANALVRDDTVSTKAGHENRRLAALLLQRNLSLFADRLLNPQDSAALSVSVWRGEMPVYYMQALLLNDCLTGDSTVVLYRTYPKQAKEQRALLDGYIALRDSQPEQSAQHRANSLSIDYHRTYWWYYDERMGE